MDDTNSVACEVGVQSPTQAAIEVLGTVDVRNGNDRDLKPYVGRRGGFGVSFYHSVEVGS